VKKEIERRALCKLFTFAPSADFCDRGKGWWAWHCIAMQLEVVPRLSHWKFFCWWWKKGESGVQKLDRASLKITKIIVSEKSKNLFIDAWLSWSHLNWTWIVLWEKSGGNWFPEEYPWGSIL